MEAITIQQKRKVGFVPIDNNSITKEKYTDLEDFLKGTISGNELVKYVCDRLEEKYSQNQSCSI